MLQLDYLPDGADDCPMLRIYGADPVVVTGLRNTLEALSQGNLESAAIDELPGFVGVGGCRLAATAGTWDRGVVQRDENSFEWILTPDAWDNVVGLVEPFCAHETGCHFQWLESAGDICVLISTTGEW